MSRLLVSIRGLLAGLLLAFTLLAAAPVLAQTAPAPADPAAAQSSPSLPAVTVGEIGGEPVSLQLQVLLLMTGITLLPAALA